MKFVLSDPILNKMTRHQKNALPGAKHLEERFFDFSLGYYTIGIT